LNDALCAWLSSGILFLPLVAFVVLLCVGKRMERGADFLAIGTMGVGFVLSAALFAVNCHRVSGTGLDFSALQAHPVVTSYNWMEWKDVTLSMGFQVDSLSSSFCMIVTGLATLVLIYSTFYLHGDALYRRYFAFMCFFCFAMLGIVLSNNLLMTFVFWELVGLGSYFLIGFWFHKPPVAQDQHYQELKASYATGIDERYLSPAHAQRKAFVMNRVGDFGFISGIMIFVTVVLAAATQKNGLASGPLDFVNLYRACEGFNGGVFNEVTLWGMNGLTLLTLAGILTFMGAMGKSAQFPLHTWLPDAMQGPTTGSSIIHAATMVAAGVYLVARIHPLLTPGALFFIALIGGITAFIAATMAMVQWDIKAVLAYSTISQLGYMMIGLGSDAYTAGIAHLYTHAIFKCMLFLCAGSVIHACQHVQDMNRLGGLRHKMPLTFYATSAGVLAIIGFPFFSGFYSKDAILAGACARGLEWGGLHWLPYLLGQVTATLTAFYMCRLWFWTFFGQPRDRKMYAQVHESPPVATVPLIILAVLCFGFWWSGHPVGADSGPSITPLCTQTERLSTLGSEVRAERVTTGWLDAMLVSPEAERLRREALLSPHAAEHLHAHEHIHHTAHTWATVLSILGMLGGMALAWWMYGAKSLCPDRLVERHPLLSMGYELASQLWFFDRLYQDGIVPLAKVVNKGLYWFDFQILDQILVDGWAYFARTVAQVCSTFDNWVVDRIVDLFALVTGILGQGSRSLQAGKIQYYVCLTFGAVALVLVVLVMM